MGPASAAASCAVIARRLAAGIGSGSHALSKHAGSHVNQCGRPRCKTEVFGEMTILSGIVFGDLTIPTCQ
jgi:hypothetical protein